MAKTLDVVTVVGSLRRDSFTRRLVKALDSVAPSTIKLEVVEIGNLPLFNQDDESNPPAAWVAFRARIKRADAVLFATPEYNRSVPAALKNAVDVGSRPYGSSVWSGKPAAIISVSPGNIGGFGANHHLRQSLVFLDMPTMQQPEAYVSAVDKLIDAGGAFATPSSGEFFTKFLSAFETWMRRHIPD